MQTMNDPTPRILHFGRTDADRKVLPPPYWNEGPPAPVHILLEGEFAYEATAYCGVSPRPGRWYGVDTVNTTSMSIFNWAAICPACRAALEAG